MDTACLRIKFTPLLQKNVINSSKCCLEIVPEVSCIQNLDKLTWKQETSFIEYTIPMTYRVIVKRRQAITNVGHDVKTYHSCVDLLLCSSKDTNNIGSGDVSKIISDTFIFSKPVSSSREEIVVRNALDDVPSPGITSKYPISHKTTTASIRLVDSDNKGNKSNEDDTANTTLGSNIESIILDKASLDKITSTESIYLVNDNTVTCGNTIFQVDPLKSCSKFIPELRRRLSLSPICSVSTQQAPAVVKHVACKAVTCKIYDSQKDIVPVGCLSTASNLSNEIQVSKELSTIIDISGQCSQRILRNQSRVPPEIRVAEHLEYIEKEVLPLKTMFNEIISKCSMLGLNFNSKKPSKPSLVYKTMSIQSSAVEEYKQYSSLKMKNQQAVVDKIVQNLAFEVEAVPKEPTHDSSLSKVTPLNVKIKVRKKHETYTDTETSSVTDERNRNLQKIRVVSSDQTIMTFDVFMEAEFERQPSKKSKKHIFDILRPGVCFNTLDKDKYAYTPGVSYSANISEPSESTRSDGIFRQNFTLSKNNYDDYSVATQSGVQKWPFGRCKPGGCLDPPFSEDKYSYEPAIPKGNENILLRPNISEEENKIEDDKSENKSNGKRSSLFDGGIFKKKRKSSDKSTNTIDSETIGEIQSNTSVFELGSATNSLSTHSNSIITYPPKISSDLRISDDKPRSRGPSDEKPRKSFNEHSEPYFIPPKELHRVKDNDYLNQKEDKRPSKENDSGKKPDTSMKPLPIPIPIPIPFPFKPKIPPENADTGKTHPGGDDKSLTKPIPDKDDDDNVLTVTNSAQSELKKPGVHEDSKTSVGFKSVVSEPDNVYEGDRTNSNEISVKDKETKVMPVPLPIPIPILPGQLSKDKRGPSLVNEVIDELSDPSLTSASVSNTESPSVISDEYNDKSIQAPKNDHDTSQNSLNKDDESSDVKKQVQGDTAREPDEDKDKNKLEKSHDPDLTKQMGDQGKDLEETVADNSLDSKMPSDETDKTLVVDVEKPKEKNGDKQLQPENKNNDTKLPLDNEQGRFYPDNTYPFNKKNPNDIIAAPVIIDDNGEEFGELHQIYSSIDLIDDPVIEDINNDQVKTANDDDAINEPKHDLEVERIPSVIYDSNGYICFDKHPGKKTSPDQAKTILTKPTNDNEKKKHFNLPSELSSSSTLKSALKKDTITIELAFHSYLNDKNERIVKTLDASHDPVRVPNDTITLIKSQIRLTTNEIRIPVDSDHDLSIQIKKPCTNQHVSISESVLDNGKKKPRVSAKTSGADLKELDDFHKIGNESVLDLYEQELIPLQLIIKSLRDEIDVLAAQQMMFRDKIFCTKKSKLPRLIQSNKKCVGCLKK
ncbi:unnamed protein product [Chrysodeixis includens]|uniref:Uncharacterized protein n=1 Tax=Chrysodeixis includens TaxID=689277 RepID=A0A9P0FTK4_CHRIL|nr:unnamed protein product [Chrysodeixis includens]